MTAEQNLRCREIVKEIINFPVSQRQIYMIMYLLSLNIENFEHSQELSAALHEMRNDIHLADNSLHTQLKLDNREGAE